MMQRGAMVVVPRLAEGVGCLGHKQWYKPLRHFDRLQKNCYLRGMGDTVVKVVKYCLFCKKEGFQESGRELQPLPIRELGY